MNFIDSTRASRKPNSQLLALRAVVWWLDHREVVAFSYLNLDRSVRRLAASKFG